MIENDQWEPAMALASSSEAHPRWIASMCTASRVAAPRAESASDHERAPATPAADPRIRHTPRRDLRYAARYYGVPRRWLEMWRRLRRNGLSITRCYINGYLMQVVVIADKHKCPKVPKNYKNYTEEVI